VVVSEVEDSTDEGLGERNKEEKGKEEMLVAPIVVAVLPSGWRLLSVSLVVSVVCEGRGGGGVVGSLVCKHLMDLGG
jgi:hypothetical protein